MDSRLPLPVTVLCGLRGAGKTSTIKHILADTSHGLKIAVLVSDVPSVLGAEGVDPDSVFAIPDSAKMASMFPGNDEFVMQDLLSQIAEIANSKKFDYLVMESMGLGSPYAVAQTFNEDVPPFKVEGRRVIFDTAGKQDPFADGPTYRQNPLQEVARLDTAVTVVDASTFFDSLSQHQRVREQLVSMGAQAVADEINGTAADRALPDVMVDQLEFADVVLISKGDVLRSQGGDAGAKELKAVEGVVRKLNPKAKVVHVEKGNCKLPDIMDTKMFDMTKIAMSAGWMTELAKKQEKGVSTTNYLAKMQTAQYGGVSSIVFRANKPFHPTRLFRLLHGFGAVDLSSVGGRQWAGDLANRETGAVEPLEAGHVSAFKGVIRSRGGIWLANGHATGFDWHTAGRVFSIKPAQVPFLSRLIETNLGLDWLGQKGGVSEEVIVTEAAKLFGGPDSDGVRMIQELGKDGMWSREFGDRRNELVLIGVKLDESAIKAALENALVSEAEANAGVLSWKNFDDAFFGGAIVEEFWDVLGYDEGDDDTNGDDPDASMDDFH